jgi:hypothetical protein
VFFVTLRLNIDRRFIFKLKLLTNRIVAGKKFVAKPSFTATTRGAAIVSTDQLWFLQYLDVVRVL